MFDQLRRLVGLQKEQASFQPENELERAMLKASQNPRYMGEFYRALWYADVYIPQHGPAPQQETRRVIGAGETLALSVFTFNNRTYVPACSSMTQLLRYVPRGSAYIRFKGQALAEMWDDRNWLFLNPRGQLGVSLSPAEVCGLPDGPGPSSHRLTRETAVRPSAPGAEPRELLQAIRAYCPRNPAITRCFQALIDDPERPGMSAVFLGVEVTPDTNAEAVLREVYGAVRMVTNDAFYMVPILGPNDDSGTAQVWRNFAPFYERGR